MLPAVNAITAYTPPPTIVATNIPGNNTLRVPPANVSPPVSSVQISNDARGNNPAIPGLPTEGSRASIASSFSSFIANFNGTPTTLSMGAQTTFLAQLMSQDGGRQAKSVLSEYEKMLSIAEVKYKPSNATMPQAEPAGVFGKILEQESQIHAVQKIIVEQAANTNIAPANNVQIAKPQIIANSEKSTSEEVTPAETNGEQAAAPAVQPRPRAISAYLATVSRNDSKSQDTTESV